MAFLDCLVGVGFLMSSVNFSSAPAWRALSQHVSPYALGWFLLGLGILRMVVTERGLLRFYVRGGLALLSASTWSLFMVVLLVGRGSVILPLLCFALIAPNALEMVRTAMETKKKYGLLGWHFGTVAGKQRAADYEQAQRLPWPPVWR